MTESTEDRALADGFADYYETERYDDLLDFAQSDDRVTFELDADELPDELREDFGRSPDRVLDAAEDAIDRVQWDDGDAVPDDAFDDIRVRVVGLPGDRLYDVGRWDPNDVIGELVSVRGQVTKRSKRKLRDDVTLFSCSRCGTETTVPQAGDVLQTPHECMNCDRQGPFDVVDHESEMEAYQRIRLQALPEKVETATTGSIDVILDGDLVGETEPGDRVVVNGVVESERVRRGSTETRIRDLYVTARGIEHLDTGRDDVDVEPYRDDVEDIANAPDTFEQLVDSVAPEHKGGRMVKKALLLMLFGGVEKVLPDGTEQRGNSHVLLIGDPGTGKSMLVEWVADVAPRAEFATGKQSSASGLTATAVQDESFGGGGWTLEAGTLVRAHNGIACIDELDKMKSDDRDGMVEAMSKQEININKAASGTLPAKTTVLAAANPKYGSFDPNADIGEQLDLAPVLLSRFDLWFVITDEPDEQADRELAEHMNTVASAGQKNAAEKPLSSDEEDTVTPTVDTDTLRAYVAIARDIHPVLTDDAKELITENYVELRQANDDGAPVPTSARTIGAIHRLSEASARIRLSEEIETEDVERAIDIRDYCMEQLGMDPETGNFDAVRHETGVPSSQHDRVKTVKGIVQSVEEKFDEEDAPGAPEDAIREKAVDVLGISESKFEATFDDLREKGEIYQPRTGYWRVS